MNRISDSRNRWTPYSVHVRLMLCCRVYKRCKVQLAAAPVVHYNINNSFLSISFCSAREVGDVLKTSVGKLNSKWVGRRFHGRPNGVVEQFGRRIKTFSQSSCTKQTSGTQNVCTTDEFVFVTRCRTRSISTDVLLRGLFTFLRDPLF